MPTTYFVDTSALLPYFLKGAPGYAWAYEVFDPSSENDLVIAEITEVELAASLNQLVRGGTLRKKTCDEALSLFWAHVANDRYEVIGVTTSIVRRAVNLCDSHSLKGFDAIQLAAALTARENLPEESALGEIIFLTQDQRLAAAAVAEGFVFDSPLNHA